VTASSIRIDSLTYRYPNAAGTALDNISFEIPAGKTFGLLGPNGAGKTTLISLLTGLREPQHGTIEIAGCDLHRDAERIKALSALVPQDYAFYLPLTARENLEFFADVYAVPGTLRRERIAHAVEVCRLEEVLEQRAEEYSGGLKRRLNLAIGLLNAPQILYLDEPTVGVDVRSRHTILEALKRLKASGITIVYTSHYMEEVQAICDHLSIIDHGRVLACDSMQGFLARATTPRLLIQLGTPLTQAALDALAQWSPTSSGANCWSFLPSSSAEIERILALLREHAMTVAQVQYGVSHLEQIYLGLLEAPKA
jgi:ABC-2 type transport system ATP-binding protein